MRYKEKYTESFLKDVKAIKKDKVLVERLHKKIDEILLNPEHYPLKKYDLKGKRGVHIGSYVILFEIKNDEIIFYNFKHHDHVYE